MEAPPLLNAVKVVSIVYICNQNHLKTRNNDDEIFNKTYICKFFMRVITSDALSSAMFWVYRFLFLSLSFEFERLVQ